SGRTRRGDGAARRRPRTPSRPRGRWPPRKHGQPPRPARLPDRRRGGRYGARRAVRDTRVGGVPGPGDTAPAGAVLSAPDSVGPVESGLGTPAATTRDRRVGRTTGVRRRGPRQPAGPGGRGVVPRRHRAPPVAPPGLLPAVAPRDRAAERGARRGGQPARRLTSVRGDGRAAGYRATATAGG